MLILPLLLSCKHGHNNSNEIVTIDEDCVGEKPLSAIDNCLKLNEYFIQEEVYPINYRGAYINEKGYLTVNLSNEDTVMMRDYISGIIGSNNFEIDIRGYSNEYLKQIMDSINYFAGKNPGSAIVQYLSAWSVDEKK